MNEIKPINWEYLSFPDYQFPYEPKKNDVTLKFIEESSWGVDRKIDPQVVRDQMNLLMNSNANFKQPKLKTS